MTTKDPTPPKRGPMRWLYAPRGTAVGDVRDIIITGDARGDLYDSVDPWTDLGASKGPLESDSEEPLENITFGLAEMLWENLEHMVPGGSSCALAGLWQDDRSKVIHGYVWSEVRKVMLPKPKWYATGESMLTPQKFIIQSDRVIV